MKKLLPAMAVLGIWLLVFGGFEFVAYLLNGERAFIDAFFVSFLWASIAAAFLYDKIYRTSKPDCDYHLDQKYIDIFDKAETKFLRHNGKVVGLTVVKADNPHLYVFDLNPTLSEAHPDGVKTKYADMNAGYLRVYRIENGYRVTWTGEEEWILL